MKVLLAVLFGFAGYLGFACATLGCVGHGIYALVNGAEFWGVFFSHLGWWVLINVLSLVSVIIGAVLVD